MSTDSGIQEADGRGWIDEAWQAPAQTPARDSSAEGTAYCSVEPQRASNMEILK